MSTGWPIFRSASCVSLKLAVMMPQEVAALTTQQVAALTVQQVAALTAQQVAARGRLLPPAHFNYQVIHLTGVLVAPRTISWSR